MKTIATIGRSNWKTAIWFDTKAKGYLLPIKLLVRKKEKIGASTQVKVQLHFEVEKTTYLKMMKP